MFITAILSGRVPPTGVKLGKDSNGPRKYVLRQTESSFSALGIWAKDNGWDKVIAVARRDQ